MVAKITLNYKDALNQLKKEVENEAVKITNRKTDELYDDIVANTPVASGRLQRGWRITAGVRGLKRIVNDVPYAKYIEFGTSKVKGRRFIRRAILNNGFKGTIDTQ